MNAIREKLIEILDRNSGYTDEELAETVADRLLQAGVTFGGYLGVGTTIYQTDGIRIYESKVKSVIYDAGAICFNESAVGSSIFTSKEEAEQRLV